MARELVERLADRLSVDLDNILAKFKRGAKVTVIVRCPWLKDGDTVIGNDDIKLAVECALRMEKRTAELTEQGGFIEPSAKEGM